MSELDSTKARLRILEQNVVNKDGNPVGNGTGNSVSGKNSGNNSGKSELDKHSTQSAQQNTQPSQQQNTQSAHPPPATSSGHKSESNHRVHFDLNNATTSAEIRKPARTTRPSNGSNVANRPNNVHLPSDARQKLEQLVITIKISLYLI